MIDYKSIIDNIKAQISTTFSGVIVDNYKNFKPTLRSPWVRVVLLPSESVNVSQGHDSIIEHNGLLQIDVFTPVNTDINFNIVNDLVTVLNEKRFINDLVLDRTWRGVDSIEEEWIRTPIFSRFRYYQFNVGIND